MKNLIIIILCMLFAFLLPEGNYKHYLADVLMGLGIIAQVLIFLPDLRVLVGVHNLRKK